MYDWEGLNLYTGLIEELEYAPGVRSDGAYDERSRVLLWLEGKRKPFLEDAYSLYLDKGRRPWCDSCGQPVLFREMSGWYHVEKDFGHGITLKQYNAGCEAEIIKRLKFEI